jgi:hypothetical protein
MLADTLLWGVNGPMKCTSRRAALLFLISLSGARYLPAQSQVDQAQVTVFVAQYVAAFNAKDTARMHALYHPKSLACITPESKSFYDDEMANQWRDPIPASYTFKISAVNEDNLKAIEQLGPFPVRPDQELQIDYQRGDDGGTEVIYLVREKGRWFDDYPCASDQTLKQYRDDAPARAERAARFKAIADGIKEPLRSQLIALLRENKTVDAITRYKESSGQDYGTSMYVIDVLAHEPPH